jgi:hypothetical protein
VYQVNEILVYSVIFGNEWTGEPKILHTS